jgi:hypothetical protein
MPLAVALAACASRGANGLTQRSFLTSVSGDEYREGRLLPKDSSHVASIQTIGDVLLVRGFAPLTVGTHRGKSRIVGDTIDLAIALVDAPSNLKGYGRDYFYEFRLSKPRPGRYRLIVRPDTLPTASPSVSASADEVRTKARVGPPALFRDTLLAIK